MTERNPKLVRKIQRQLRRMHSQDIMAVKVYCMDHWHRAREREDRQRMDTRWEAAKEWTIGMALWSSMDGISLIGPFRRGDKFKLLSRRGRFLTLFCERLDRPYRLDAKELERWAISPEKPPWDANPETAEGMEEAGKVISDYMEEKCR